MVHDATTLTLVLNCFFERALFISVLPTQSFPRYEKSYGLKIAVALDVIPLS
jgi:hypothetical protein